MVNFGVPLGAQAPDANDRSKDAGEKAVASIKALNIAFANWVVEQTASAQAYLWIDAAEDYIRQARSIVADYKSSLNGAGEKAGSQAAAPTFPLQRTGPSTGLAGEASAAATAPAKGTWPPPAVAQQAEPTSHASTSSFSFQQTGMGGISPAPPAAAPPAAGLLTSQWLGSQSLPADDGRAGDTSAPSSQLPSMPLFGSLTKASGQGHEQGATERADTNVFRANASTLASSSGVGLIQKEFAFGNDKAPQSGLFSFSASTAASGPLFGVLTSTAPAAGLASSSGALFGSSAPQTPLFSGLGGGAASTMPSSGPALGTAAGNNDEGGNGEADDDAADMPSGFEAAQDENTDILYSGKSVVKSAKMEAPQVWETLSGTLTVRRDKESKKPWLQVVGESGSIRFYAIFVEGKHGAFEVVAPKEGKPASCLSMALRVFEHAPGAGSVDASKVELKKAMLRVVPTSLGDLKRALTDCGCTENS